MDRAQHRQIIARARSMIARINREQAADFRQRRRELLGYPTYDEPVTEAERDEKMDTIRAGLKEDAAKRKHSEASKQRALNILNDTDAVKLAKRRAVHERAKRIVAGA